MSKKRLRLIGVYFLFILAIWYPVGNLLYRTLGGVTDAVVVAKNLECIDGVPAYGRPNILVEFELFGRDYDFRSPYFGYLSPLYCEIKVGETISVSYVVLTLTGKYATSFRLGQPDEFLGGDIFHFVFMFFASVIVLLYALWNK